MIKEFREFIEQESLCSRDDSILVAVSGGLDSMVLLDLFLHGVVPVVLDGIVGPAREALGDVGPASAVLLGL